MLHTSGGALRHAVGTRGCLCGAATQIRCKHDPIGAAWFRILQACSINFITHVGRNSSASSKLMRVQCDRPQPDRCTALRPTDAITFVSPPQPLLGDFADQCVRVQ